VGDQRVLGGRADPVHPADPGQRDPCTVVAVEQQGATEQVAGVALTDERARADELDRERLGQAAEQRLPGAGSAVGPEPVGDDVTEQHRAQ